MASQSLTSYLQSIHELMYDAPGNFFIKDLKGYYLYANKGVEQLAGESVEGKTDFMTPWACYADRYREGDQLVVHKNQRLQESQLIKDYQRIVLPRISHKKAFYHNGVLVGSSGITLSIPDDQLTNQMSYSHRISFFDMRRRQELVLSPRHHQILYWLLKGYSAPQVAAQLFISKRTVENHMQAIKEENGYDSSRELLLQVRSI